MLFCGGLRGLEEREVVLGHDAHAGVVHDRVEDEPRAARGGERAAKWATEGSTGERMCTYLYVGLKIRLRLE